MNILRFNFEHWFNLLTLSENVHDKYERAELDLVANGMDVSSYMTSYNLVIYDIKVIQKDTNDKYFIEIQIPSIADITTGFTVYPYHSSEKPSTYIKMDLILDGQLLPMDTGKYAGMDTGMNAYTKLVNACADNNDIKIRLTFVDQPVDIRFKYVCYILQPELREYIRNISFILHGIKYSDGLAVKL